MGLPVSILALLMILYTARVISKNSDQIMSLLLKALHDFLLNSKSNPKSLLWTTRLFSSFAPPHLPLPSLSPLVFSSLTGIPAVP